MQKTRQSQTADFAPGVQFAVVVYDDDIEQCGATWAICWKFMTSCSSTTFTWILPMSHSTGPIMGKYDLISKTEDDQNHGSV